MSLFFVAMIFLSKLFFFYSFKRNIVKDFFLRIVPLPLFFLNYTEWVTQPRRGRQTRMRHERVTWAEGASEFLDRVRFLFWSVDFPRSHFPLAKTFLKFLSGEDALRPFSRRESSVFKKKRYYPNFSENSRISPSLERILMIFFPVRISFMHI